MAGSGAAIACVLVSLPLRSPSDAMLNSATVMAGGLLAGLACGVLRRALDARVTRPNAIFIAGLLACFALISLGALAAETYIERSVSFILPLAGLALGIAGALTLLLRRSSRPVPWWAVTLTLVLAVGLGLALAGRGDQQDGRLELPPRGASRVLDPPYITLG